MDSMLERLEALERQSRTVARRLHLWRGLACALIVLGLLTWALPSVTAQEARKKKKDLEQRVAALEDLLKHFTRVDNEVFITGANLHIVNGLDTTETTNGLGNLIVGYNELREENPPPGCSPGEGPFCTDTRTGSHNVVVGMRHNFSSFGGLVVGHLNDISAAFASISGGCSSTASGKFSSVSGGCFHTASGHASSVSGGGGNIASGNYSSVSGGFWNTASGGAASVSGGESNEAEGSHSSVSGGRINSADSSWSSISGGEGIGIFADYGWRAGSFGDDVSGRFSSP
jgi:hypothetical protein